MKRDLERSEVGECTFTPLISKGTEHILRSKQEIERMEAEAEAARLRAIANQKNLKNVRIASVSARKLGEFCPQRRV